MVQIEKVTIDKVKIRMKQHYPGIYALKILERLRSRKISVSRQQIYNCFNGLRAERGDLIINTALELLKEARENEKQLTDDINVIYNDSSYYKPLSLENNENLSARL
jgi:hypothetical protein